MQKRPERMIASWLDPERLIATAMAQGSSATGMIAYVSNDTVYIAPATSPGSATSVGSLGNGGFAWTPWGLALASGGTVSIITPDCDATPVVTGGGDLTAPIWTGDALLVSDATDGGTNRRLPADTIGSILGG